jgi:AcrR family transcriptional regulator
VRRTESQQRTRDDLLGAAVRVFARRGFRAARLEEVATEAGYTTGAVYSNFGGKDDLFLAAFEREIARHVAEVDAAVEDAADGAERTRAAADQWIAYLDAAPEMFPLFVEYWSYAMRDPAHRPRFQERFGAFRDATARMIESAARERDWRLPMPARDLAVAVNALTYGIAFERLAEPDGVPADLFARVLELLFTGVEAHVDQ